MLRFLIQTFGCQMNVHDSRRIEEVLYERGYEAATEPEQADLKRLAQDTKHADRQGHVLGRRQHPGVRR